MLALLRRSPACKGLHRSRWTLHLLAQHCGALAGLTSRSGVCRRLSSWKIHHKRGRPRLWSPDPAYTSKAWRVRRLVQMARRRTDMVVLFADEKTFYRQPSVGRAWAESGSGGHRQPTAPLACGARLAHRLVGALDARTGQLTVGSAPKVGLRVLEQFFRRLRQVYGPSKKLFLIWDNWPVHAHERLQKVARQERIEVVFLPTYSPWLNPIEKVWKKLEEEVLRLHRKSRDWEGLKQEVWEFFLPFRTPSRELLRYVGLLPH